MASSAEATIAASQGSGSTVERCSGIRGVSPSGRDAGHVNSWCRDVPFVARHRWVVFEDAELASARDRLQARVRAECPQQAPDVIARGLERDRECLSDLV